MIVAAAQSVAWPGDLAGSVIQHVRLIATAADLHASLVVFPELSLTGYRRSLTLADAIDPLDARLGAVRDVAVERDIHAAVGLPLEVPNGLAIGTACYGGDGGVVVYLKQFLHEGEETAFVPGTVPGAITVGGRRVGLAICADITHPNHAVDAAADGAFIYAASCFLTPDGYDVDAALLSGHAARHRMAVIMANFGGPCGGFDSAGRSAIWNGDGMLLAQAPALGAAVVAASV
jgi:predicted amidohydrolase